MNNRMLRTLVSLAMVICLMFSLCSPALAAGADDVQDPAEEIETIKEEPAEEPAEPAEEPAEPAEEPAEPAEEESAEPAEEESAEPAEEPAEPAEEESAEPAEEESEEAVEEEPEGFIRTYNFYVDGELYYTKDIKDGEKLSRPAAPEKEGFDFAGWFTKETGGEKFTSFGTALEIEKNDTVDLYARFTEAEPAEEDPVDGKPADEEPEEPAEEELADAALLPADSLGKIVNASGSNAVHIVVGGQSFVYDGQPHVLTVTVEDLPTGWSIVYDAEKLELVLVNVDDTITWTEADKAALGLHLYNGGGQDRTDWRDVVIEWRNVTMLPCPITLRSDSAAKLYDGEPLSAPNVTVVEGSLVDGESFTYTDFHSITDVGSIDNTFTVVGVGDTNPNNYAITYQYGKLTIAEKTPIIVQVDGTTVTSTYDGNEHTASDYTLTCLTTGTDFDINSISFNGTASAARTDVGTTKMNLSADMFSCSDPIYDVTYVINDGFVKINPLDVTVTIEGDTVTATYDGNAHTATGYTVSTSTDLLTEDMIVCSAAETPTASQTDVGYSPMGLTADMFSLTDESNFGQVTFIIVDGFAEVEKAEVTVTITGNYLKKTYDGQPHSVSGFMVEDNSAVYDSNSAAPDYTFSGTASASRTEKGTTYMGLSSDMFSNINDNFEVAFNVTDGYVQIDPVTEKVTVTITGHTAGATYDGQPHSASGYDVSISDPAFTESMISFSGPESVTGTDADTYYMGLAASQFSYTGNNFGEVEFVIAQDGVLTIAKRSVTLTSGDKNKPYDGTACYNHAVTVGGEGFVSGEGVEYSNFASVTEVEEGEVSNTFDYAAKDGTDLDNYDITPYYGTLQVTGATAIVVTVTGNKTEAPYDGDAHTAEGFTVVSIKQGGEATTLYTAADFSLKSDVSASASQTNVGTAYMGLTGDSFRNNNTNFAEVTFIVSSDGYAKVNPIDVVVTITGHNDTVDYDGDEHTVTGYDAKADTDLYDVDADISFSGTAVAIGTDADTYEMGLAASQFTNTNDNFASVTFVIEEDGWLEIDPIDVVVTITGHNDTVDYDGDEHTVTGYDAKADTDLYDIDNDFTFSGTAEAKGTDADTYEMGLAAGQFENTNDNFASVTFVIEEDGWLEIDPIDVVVTITGHNDTVDYDGDEHTVTGYDAKADTDLYDVDADISFSGTAEAKGTDADTYEMGLAASQFTNDNTNFNVSFEIEEDGYLTINPAGLVTVTITGHTTTATYDGNSHSAEGFDFESSDPLFTQDMISFSGTASVSGKAAGEYPMGLKESQFSNNNTANFPNVKFVVTDGKLTIDPLPVTVEIIGHTDDVIYDGIAHSVSGYDVGEISSTLFTKSLIDFDGTAVVKATEPGEYGMGLVPENFKSLSRNFEVTFTVTDGSLLIRPVFDVTYRWTGKVPAGEKLPATIEGVANKLIEGTDYNALVDTTYTAGMTVETFDKYGNLNGRYTFSGWTVPNSGIIVNGKNQITGEWTFEEIEVPRWSITYEWTGNAPGYCHLPAPVSVVNGAPYEVDTSIDTETVYYTYDQNGVVISQHNFSGWDTGDIAAVTQDYVIRGSWESELMHYTIRYEDGVGGEAFPAQVYWRVYGAPTPEYGNPAREGYIFVGWTPSVSARVYGDAVYTAQWEKVTAGSFGISLMGDVNFATYQSAPHDDKSFESVIGTDWAKPFANVAELIGEDTLSLCNLTNIFTDLRVGSDAPFASKAPADYISFLTENGIEIASLANNRTHHYGEDAFDDMLEQFNERGVRYLKDWESHVLTTPDGISVGLLSICEQCNAEMVRSGVRRLAENKTDLVIVNLFWNNLNDVSDEMMARRQTVARAAIDAGADVVIGNGLETMQKAEEYNGGYIFYSLGKFLCGGTSVLPEDTDAVLIELNVDRDDEGNVTLNGYTPIPCRMSSSDDVNDYQPKLFDEGSEEYERIIDRLNDTWEKPEEAKP